ncbi:MFS transporter [Phaeospirillum tilakii]|uniref:MFS transporter n=1 Tax=Phaeospirillum tilakii TaxID=741673 RepID=A0ABW5CG02_9PROT
MSPFRLLCLSRTGTCLAAMAYAGALPVLITAWGMDGATAGGVQASYNAANAVALLLVSALADRVGARRVYLGAIWLAAGAAVLFAAFARSPASAMGLVALMAAAQGAAYTPALMLVAEMVPPARRGGAFGSLLAAGSFGYLLSVLTALGGAALLDYRWGFACCAVGPLLGAVAGTLALRRHPAAARPRPAAGERGGLAAALFTPLSLLLTLGYAAHCWELLGAWAWMPAFLAGALAPLGLAPLLSGLVVAGAVHLAGTLATLTVGRASDRWGRRPVLVAVATLGALGSASLGWSAAWGPWAAVAVAFAASFFIVGDSGVLSAAMSEAVPPRHLGTALALRSILGFGAGTLSPVAFGLALDAGAGWGGGFLTLAAGGAVAALAALCLRRR